MLPAASELTLHKNKAMKPPVNAVGHRLPAGPRDHAQPDTASPQHRRPEFNVPTQDARWFCCTVDGPPSPRPTDAAWSTGCRAKMFALLSWRSLRRQRQLLETVRGDAPVYRDACRRCPASRSGRRRCCRRQTKRAWLGRATQRSRRDGRAGRRLVDRRGCWPLRADSPTSARALHRLADPGAAGRDSPATAPPRMKLWRGRAFVAHAITVLIKRLVRRQRPVIRPSRSTWLRQVSRLSVGTRHLDRPRPCSWGRATRAAATGCAGAADGAVANTAGVTTPSDGRGCYRRGHRGLASAGASKGEEMSSDESGDVVAQPPGKPWSPGVVGDPPAPVGEKRGAGRAITRVGGGVATTTSRCSSCPMRRGVQPGRLGGVPRRRCA